MSTQQQRDAPEAGWLTLLGPDYLVPLAVLLGGILLHSMNVLLTATVLPSIVQEVGGTALMSWATTGFLAASIVAATSTGFVRQRIGARRAYCVGAGVFCVGALLCATAPTMFHFVGGRVIQGFGGGLLSGLAYVLVRNVFPKALWARIFALLSGVWGISIVVGPLIGGLFAAYGIWRGAFVLVCVLAALVATFAWRGLSAETAPATGGATRVPLLRVTLICLSIVILSAAAIMPSLALRLVLIIVALAALAAMMRLDRNALSRLLPSDAFSLGTPTGTGLWVALLMSITYSPFPIYGPLFLQHLHGLGPLEAGYVVAAQSMAWTVASTVTAPFRGRAIDWAIGCGPISMMIGLAIYAVLLAPGPVLALVVPAFLVGSGIGGAWAYVAQRVMHNARVGEEDGAASSIATVQQTGLALGAALAGLSGNAAGLSGDFTDADMIRATVWVPLTFLVPGLAAALIAARLNATTREKERVDGATAKP